MKAKLSLAVLCTLEATTLHAKPMAFVKIAGGFCQKQCPTTTISIHDSGEVIAETEVFAPEHKVAKTTLVQLNANIIRAVKKDIAAASIAALIDSNPDDGFCADLPEQSFNIVKGNRAYEIGKQRDCHSYVLKNGEATGIITSLEGFIFLNNYSQI